MGKKILDLPLTAYILCKNKLVKKYTILATKKFNVDDETYVIKKKCCYPRISNGMIEIIAVYSEGNPNPYNLNSDKENIGLSESELDSYISGDVHNIVAECQRTDRSVYVLSIACIMFGLFAVWFFSKFVLGV